MSRNFQTFSKLTIASTILVLITACAPQRLQYAEVIDYNEGRPVYAMNGYTGPGETTAGSSKQYIQHALEDACPAGFDIMQLTENATYNGCCQFLQWSAKVECK